jgi:hypothetical protein
VKYADDLVLLDKEGMVLPDMINKLIEIGRCYGMVLNSAIMNKWKWLFINIFKFKSPISSMTEFLKLYSDKMKALISSGFMVKTNISLKRMSYIWH